MDLFEKCKKVNRYIYLFGGFALMFMMLLTVADVILREFDHPIVGTYELVGFSAAVVIGFCIPYTTSVRSHITVDFLTMRLPAKVQKVLLIITRFLGIFLFVFVGYNLFKMGMDLYRSGEVSLTIQVPFYPIAFGIGACCFLQAITQLADVIGIIRRQA
ncbi:MAG: TRAP transporter small permease [Syntrophorhabdaceae bacterium]|nr:TRAP transporter small permease [Syntrophorhabdaceae bacterium]MDD5243979.1 TRAP transporter small permease [Syntrophorhabdaceae bacterium]